MIGSFNDPLSNMDGTYRVKINKKSGPNTIDKMNVTNIYKLFHPITKYIFFTTTHRKFSRIDHMLGHNKYFFLSQCYETRNLEQSEN